MLNHEGSQGSNLKIHQFVKTCCQNQIYPFMPCNMLLTLNKYILRITIMYKIIRTSRYTGLHLLFFFLSFQNWNREGFLENNK